jgi:hypothetical protein
MIPAVEDPSVDEVACYLYRRWMSRFNTLGDGRRRSAYRDRDAGHNRKGRGENG